MTRKKLKRRLRLAGLDEATVERLMADVVQHTDLLRSKIERLQREREVDDRKIAGALKDTINQHGPITSQFVASATKRVSGNLLKN